MRIIYINNNNLFYATVNFLDALSIVPSVEVFVNFLPSKIITTYAAAANNPPTTRLAVLSELAMTTILMKKKAPINKSQLNSAG